MDDTFGGLIRRAREAKGPTWTLDYVARQLGRPATWLSNVETGKTKSLPEPNEMRRLGAMLGLSMPELLQSAGFLSPGDLHQDRASPFAPDDPRWQLVEKLKRIEMNDAGARFAVKAMTELLNLYLNERFLFDSQEDTSPNALDESALTSDDSISL